MHGAVGFPPSSEAVGPSVAAAGVVLVAEDDYNPYFPIISTTVVSPSSALVSPSSALIY